MRLAKPIFLALLALSLATFAFDCGATMTPEQSMQCCNSMPCSSQGHHGQDCCKTMASMHAPFVQPSTVRGVAFHSVLSAVLPPSSQSPVLAASAIINSADYHAPPVLNAPSLGPLRI